MQRTAQWLKGVLTPWIVAGCGLDTMGVSVGEPGTGPSTSAASLDDPTTSSAMTEGWTTIESAGPVGACGDGAVQALEECDHGEANGEDKACTHVCTWAVCGDGFVHAGVEGCDDGAMNGADQACTDFCAVATCGDGYVHAGVEGCDDGAMNGADQACTDFCAAATCGDGFVHAGVEGCDEGAMNGADQACTDFCAVAVCGDGFVHAGVEGCDDGAMNGEDQACTHLCSVATCGDGFVHAGIEVCDPGSPLAHAGCEGCQGLTCDDGWGDCDNDPGTGCEANLENDEDHCGGCGNDCFVKPCLNGACHTPD